MMKVITFLMKYYFKNKFKVIVKDKGKEKSINAIKENYQISMF